jgi:hypothetical protein
VIKNLFITFLVSVVFVGTIGVRVFTHSCEEDGVFKTYFVQVNNHCENEQKEQPLCCQKERAEKEKKDCCRDETEVFKLKLDYISLWDDFSFEPILIPVTQNFTVANKSIPLTQLCLQACNSDPPHIQNGRQILLKKRVLVI